MLYAAKCYWLGVTETKLEQVAARAALGETWSSDNGVAYLGSLLFWPMSSFSACSRAHPAPRSSAPATPPASLANA
jgi:hypothetical protein